MKKFWLLMLTVMFIFSAAACGTRTDDDDNGDDTIRIGMVTDIGDIDDESFNQGTWEGIVEYAIANNISHRYYQPAGEGLAEYLDAIDLAVGDGAEIIITPGFMFEIAIYEAQTDYPDVIFVLLDGEPRPGQGQDADVAENTIAIYYAEHESGFLAGYAAVKDGLTNLGFIGGIPVPAVVRFGIGFIAGAYMAAKEEGIVITFGPDQFHYAMSFAPGDEHRVFAASWYNAGVEVIFTAAGGVGSSVAAAAAETENWMIGVDVDQAGMNDWVLTSALKALGVSVQQQLEAYFNDEFVGGQTLLLTAAEDGVGLPFATSRFTTFTETDYNDIFGRLADKSVLVPVNYDALVIFFNDHDLGELPFEATDVN